MDIPSQYNPKEVEEKIHQLWLKGDCFNADINPQKKPFSIVIPPPNITGILHMGHALNNTIQDVLIRFKRMQGFEVLWMPGTDHAGIATQNVVEKDLAKQELKKEDIGRDEFLKKLWAWRDEYGSTIIEQLKKLGASCDWRRTRFTMDEDYSRAVKEVFVNLYEKGLVYRGNYIINWCPRCKTALSDEESAHKEIDGFLYYIKYPLKKSIAPIPQSSEKLNSINYQPSTINYIVVATTRPETMLGDTAVAINPKDSRYRWLGEAGVILPIVERELKVIEDEAVDLEFGTGVVKVTPAHDPIDFGLGKKHNLEFINIMNDDATLNEFVPPDFVGLDRFKARDALLEILEEKGLIEKKEPYKISAGHCYRCHTIIEPRVSLQWFVKMKPLAKRAIRVVEEDEIKFSPVRWKKVYLNWMHDIHDWCISRQIWWGHQLPVYYCRKCQEAEMQNSKCKIQNGEEKQKRNKGIIVAKKKPDKCPDCGSTDLYQDEDVLDTWFSSWLWPFATFGWPFKQHSAVSIQLSADRKEELKADSRARSEAKPPRGGKLKAESELNYFYPTNVLVTASEILFFWVARMIMAGMEFMGEIPFRDVLIHGTVRDSKGIKMSKSLGNIIDPLEIIDKFGADALRFSLMQLVSSGADAYLTEEKFLVGRNFSNKIWNAARFLLLKIKENNLKIDNLDFKELDEIDKWILKELNQTIEEVTLSLENCHINSATKKIYDFFWHKFCDWYIEIVKDKFTANKSKVLIYVLTNSLKMLHPLMPFITEEVFQLIKNHTSLSQDETIMKSSWPAKTHPSKVSGWSTCARKGIQVDRCELEINKEKTEGIETLLDTIGQIRNIKIDLGIATKKVKLEVKLKGPDLDLWKVNQPWIKRLARLETIEFREDLERVLYKSERGELNLIVEDIEIKNFLSSLEKKIKKLTVVFEKISQRLKNKDFLGKARPDTVEEEKIKFEQISNQIRRLTELRNAFKDADDRK